MSTAAQPNVLIQWSLSIFSVMGRVSKPGAEEEQ